MATARTAKTGRKKAATKASRTKKATTKRKAPATKAKAKATTAKAKTAAKSTAKKAATKKPARKAAPEKPKTPPIEILARKIVKAAQDSEAFPIEELYAEDAISYEAGSSDPAVGHEGLRQKLASWEEMLGEATSQWRPKNIFAKSDTICIEWDAVIKTESGDEIRFAEVAIHEIRDNMIASERYYYDRGVLAALAPAAAESMPSAAILDEPTGTQPDPTDL